MLISWKTSTFILLSPAITIRAQMQWYCIPHSKIKYHRLTKNVTWIYRETKIWVTLSKYIHRIIYLAIRCALIQSQRFVVSNKARKATHTMKKCGKMQINGNVDIISSEKTAEMQTKLQHSVLSACPSRGKTLEIVIFHCLFILVVLGNPLSPEFAHLPIFMMCRSPCLPLSAFL